jgi:DNA-binding NarL/FixJ family response regulator
MRTTVAIVEDNSQIRRSLQEWVDSAPEYRCVCACVDAETALKEIPKFKPDVVLMDIHLPGDSGIACTARLKSILPSLQVIVVTVYRDRDLLFQALKAGACGYLLKRSSPEELLRAIAEVRTGGAPMTGEIARMVVETFQKPALEEPTHSELSGRETEILALVAKGRTNKEIGPALNISYDTVRAHLRRIYEKLHVRCRTEAVMKYLENPQRTLARENRE